jgi:hypothetical protein
MMNLVEELGFFCVFGKSTKEKGGDNHGLSNGKGRDGLHLHDEERMHE